MHPKGGWEAAVRSPWILPLAVFVLALAVYAPTASRHVVNTDVAANTLTAWHMAHTGKPWMDGLDLHEAGKVPHYGVGAGGHMVTTRTPGQVWAAMPFYLGSSASQAHFSLVPGDLAAAVMTALAMMLVFLALRRHLPALGSLGATAVLGFATPMWSVNADALWTHPVTVLGIAGAAWAISTERWWLAGVWLGMGMTGRVHVALIAAVVGVGMAWSKRSPKPAVRIAIPTLASLGLLSLWSRYVFATWDPRGAYSGHELGWTVPSPTNSSWGQIQNVAGFLASPDRGLVVWSPLLVLLLPAVVRGWRDAPHWSRWLAWGGVLYTVVQLGVQVFHGGDGFFGYRLGLELLVSITPVYAFTAHRVGRVARLLAPYVVGLQFGVMALGSIVEVTKLRVSVDHVWSDNAVWASLREWPLSVALFVVLFAAAGAVLTGLVLATLGRAQQNVPAATVPTTR